MSEIQDIPSQVVDQRLAWDMAHAEDRERFGYYISSRTQYSRGLDGVASARKASSKLEAEYHARIAAQDEDYRAIDELYDDTTVNKSDLFVFLTDRARTPKQLKSADMQTTRVWNMLGQISTQPNSHVLFGATKPTGRMKQNYQYGRNLVGREIVEYEDLELASLVHFLDHAQRLAEADRNVRGIGQATIEKLVAFADDQTAKVIEARRKS